MAHQEAAARCLADGLPYAFLARDASGWYRLYARPLAASRPPASPGRRCDGHGRAYPFTRSSDVRTEPHDDHADHQDHADPHGDARPDDETPRYVRCPRLACGRLHEPPPGRE
ncbi:hypothetical protein [Streptomyces sp. BBFR102]|uniref:hypothetical protein n=1 Tax=Streptomyces sp. BBFR102 TaxID=3448171 RepID=UPI003F53D77F